MEFSAVTQCSNDIQGSSGQRDHRSRVTIGRSQVAERERERDSNPKEVTLKVKDARVLLGVVCTFWNRPWF